MSKLLAGDDGLISSVRAAHVTDESSVLVWLAAPPDSSGEICLSIVDKERIVTSCNPVGRVTELGMGITGGSDSLERGVYLSPDSAGPSPLGVVDNGVVVIELPRDDASPSVLTPDLARTLQRVSALSD